MDDPNSTTSFHAASGLDCRVKVVDIGANPIDGAPPYAGLLRAGRADIVGFEPNPEALARLNAMKGPHETYLPQAVGDGGRHTLRFCQAPGMTSLLEPNETILNLFHGFADWGYVIATETIETVRLDDVPETSGAHLLKLDIQGAELMALGHAEARLRDAVVIQTEVEFLPMYVDQPLFGDVDSFLRARGYMFHRLLAPVSRVVRPLMVDQDVYAGLSQTVWSDAIFIRDITKLERLSNEQLVAMAMILHECYDSIDVSLMLVGEYDRRSGSAHGSAYLAGLQARHQPRPTLPMPARSHAA